MMPNESQKEQDTNSLCGSVSLYMSQKKTEITLEQVKEFLQRRFAGKPENVQQLVEGEESQAFSYEA
jgi:hypothetical protein